MTKDMKQLLSAFLFLAILLAHYSTISAQAPPPAGPTNITAILEKAGQFTTFIRLMKSTQMADQINTQLNSSNQGLTIFSPTDNAFANLKSGTLNSLTDQQKVQLTQFHVVPSFLSTSQFQTVSNPLRTQAGNGKTGQQFPLNVTTSGNQVNLTTGVVSATVDNTIYTDNQLAVYEVDKVLLPLALFPPSSSSPAPAPSNNKKAVSPTSGSGDGSSDDSSASMSKIPGSLSTMMLIVASISVSMS